MEEIKFRAWDKLNKIMHYNFQFIKSGNKGNDWIIFTSDRQTLNDSLHPLNNPYFQQQFEITHSIGLTDCNNEEYYTGDIVQTDTMLQYIDFNNSLACYGVRQFSGGGTMSIDKAWKKVGNIFENPNIFNLKLSDNK